MDNLKLLITLGSEFEAQIIKAKLSEAGIESLMQVADTADMMPALDYSGGVGIYVEEEDYDVARSMVDSGEDDLDDDMEIGVGD